MVGGSTEVVGTDQLSTPSRLSLLVGITAASVGVIYGYELSNIAGALLFITDRFHLSTGSQGMVTPAVVVGQSIGAVGGGGRARAIGRKQGRVRVAAACCA